MTLPAPARMVLVASARWAIRTAGAALAMPGMWCSAAVPMEAGRSTVRTVHGVARVSGGRALRHRGKVEHRQHRHRQDATRPAGGMFRRPATADGRRPSGAVGSAEEGLREVEELGVAHEVLELGHHRLQLGRQLLALAGPGLGLRGEVVGLMAIGSVHTRIEPMRSKYRRPSGTASSCAVRARSTPDFAIWTPASSSHRRTPGRRRPVKLISPS
jgi:hypothetical protein